MSLAYDTSKAAANHLTTSRANWPSSWLRWSTSMRWPLGGEDRPRSRSKSVNSLEGGEGESRGPNNRTGLPFVPRVPASCWKTEKWADLQDSSYGTSAGYRRRLTTHCRVQKGGPNLVADLNEKSPLLTSHCPGRVRKGIVCRTLLSGPWPANVLF
jgi:hypothetical protein